MTKWMSRLFITTTLFISTGLLALNTTTLDEINLTIAKIIAPYLDSTTKMKFAFTDLKLSSKRVESVGINSYLWKVGAANELEFSLNNLNYNYNKGVDPTTTLDAELKLDLVAAFGGVDEVDRLIPDAEELIKEVIADYTTEFGAAAIVDAKITEKRTDRQGHMESLKLEINLQIESSKLPAHLKIEDVMLLAFSTEIAVTPKGFKANLSVLSNPEYSGFHDDQAGLKEILEALIAKDQTLIEELDGLVAMIKAISEQIVNPQN